MNTTSKQSKTIRVMEQGGWIYGYKFQDSTTGKLSVVMTKLGSKIKVTAAGQVKNYRD